MLVLFYVILWKQKKNKIAQQWAPDFLDAIRGLEPISARLKTRLRLPSTVTCCLKRPQGSSKDMVKSMVKSMGILWVIFELIATQPQYDLWEMRAGGGFRYPWIDLSGETSCA